MLVMVAGIFTANAQEMTFETETIDYGTIEKGADGARTFTFVNTGEAPLVIKKVQPSCGCTVADYPKEPIAMGDTAQIGVKYNTHRASAFNKTITVYSNAKENERKILRIKGNVLAGEGDKAVKKPAAALKAVEKKK